MKIRRRLVIPTLVLVGAALGGVLLFALVASAQTGDRPEAPVFTGTNPASGSNNNFPRFLGVAQPDTIVTLHNTPDCSGQHFGVGTAAQFANPGIQVRVRDDSTTTLWAHVNLGTLAGRESPCSAVPMTYVEHTPRAAAFKRCKRKFKGKAKAKKRKKCIKRAKLLPV